MVFIGSASPRGLAFTAHPVGSWVAVEPNGTGLPSRRVCPTGLGAKLPSPPCPLYQLTRRTINTAPRTKRYKKQQFNVSTPYTQFVEARGLQPICENMYENH